MSEPWFIRQDGKVVGPLMARELRDRARAGRVGRDTLVRRGENGKWVAAEAVRGLFPVRWYYQVMGEVIGPLSHEKLIHLAQDGRLSPDTLVRSELSDEWILADRVQGLFELPAAEPAPHDQTNGPATEAAAVPDLPANSPGPTASRPSAPRHDPDLARSTRRLVWASLFLMAAAIWLGVVYVLYPRVPVTTQLTPGHAHYRTSGPGLVPFVAPWVACGVITVAVALSAFHWIRVRREVRGTSPSALWRAGWSLALLGLLTAFALMPLERARLVSKRVGTLNRLDSYYQDCRIAHETTGRWPTSEIEIVPHLEGGRLPSDPVTGERLILFEDWTNRVTEAPQDRILIAAFPPAPDGLQAVLSLNGAIRIVPSECVDPERCLLDLEHVQSVASHLAEPYPFTGLGDVRLQIRVPLLHELRGRIDRSRVAKVKGPFSTIDSQERMENLWKAWDIADPIPTIDFSSQIVLLAWGSSVGERITLQPTFDRDTANLNPGVEIRHQDRQGPQSPTSPLSDQEYVEFHLVVVSLTDVVSINGQRIERAGE